MIKKLKSFNWPVAFHWFVLIPAGAWLLFAAIAEIFMWL